MFPLTDALENGHREESSARLSWLGVDFDTGQSLFQNVCSMTLELSGLGTISSIVYLSSLIFQFSFVILTTS